MTPPAIAPAWELELDEDERSAAGAAEPDEVGVLPTVLVPLPVLLGVLVVDVKSVHIVALAWMMLNVPVVDAISVALSMGDTNRSEKPEPAGSERFAAKQDGVYIRSSSVTSMPMSMIPFSGNSPAIGWKLVTLFWASWILTTVLSVWRTSIQVIRLGPVVVQLAPLLG